MTNSVQQEAVERLRLEVATARRLDESTAIPSTADLETALSLLTSKDEEIARLRGALEPFADACQHLHPSQPDDATTLDGILVSDWRRAYAAFHEGCEPTPTNKIVVGLQEALAHARGDDAAATVHIRKGVPDAQQ